MLPRRKEPTMKFSPRFMIQTAALVAAMMAMPAADLMAKNRWGGFFSYSSYGGSSFGVTYGRSSRHGNFGISLATAPSYGYYSSPTYYYAQPSVAYYNNGRHSYGSVAVEVPVYVSARRPREPRGSDFIRANAINPVRSRSEDPRASTRTWVSGYWMTSTNGDRNWVSPHWEYR